MIFSIDRQLYQWDSNVFLHINTQRIPSEGEFLVHFAQGDKIYSMQPQGDMVLVPNIIFQSSGEFNVFAYVCEDDDTSTTIICDTFTITPRPMPPEYIYDPTPVITYPELVNLVNALRELQISIRIDVNNERDARIEADAALHDEIVQMTATYVHNQLMASDEWYIEHNLHKHPSVTVVDSGDNIVTGDISYISEDIIVIRFTGEFSGKAYLN